MADAPTCRVLAADDDPTVGFLLPAALSASRIEATVVSDGLQALAMALGGGFDLILLDVEMPGLDGLSVAEAIRQHLGDAVPLVMATGRTDPAFMARLASLNAQHLPKPINWSGLADTLLQVFRTQSPPLEDNRHP